MRIYPRPEAGDQPPPLHPAYLSTRRRAPTQPPILIPHTLSELTGPLYGHNPIAATDNDLTRQHAGETARSGYALAAKRWHDCAKGMRRA